MATTGVKPILRRTSDQEAQPPALPAEPRSPKGAPTSHDRNVRWLRENPPCGYTRMQAKGDEKRRLFYNKAEITAMMQEWMNEVDEEAGLFQVVNVKVEAGSIRYAVRWGDNKKAPMEWVDR